MVTAYRLYCNDNFLISKLLKCATTYCFFYHQFKRKILVKEVQSEPLLYLILCLLQLLKFIT